MDPPQHDPHMMDSDDRIVSATERRVSPKPETPLVEDMGQRQRRVIPYFVEDLDFDRSEEAAVIRILDTRVLSWVLFTAFILCMDRTNHANAIGDSLLEDLHIDLNIVNVGAVIHASLFFLSCFSGAIMAKRVGAANWIPILYFSWGIVILSHAFIKDTVGYLAVRSWTAITEGGVIPAILVYFGRFYKNDEYATRLALLWGVQTVGSAISGIVACGVVRLRGKLGLQGWRWLFLVDAVVTLIIAVLTWYYLPRSAAKTTGGIRGTTPWFTERQVQIAITRIIRDDHAKRHFDKPVSWADAFDTLIDPGIWFHVLLTTINLTPLTPLNTYFPLTIKAFKLNVFISNAMTFPPHVIQCVFTILLIRHSDKTRERGFHGAIGACWQLIGWIILLVLPTWTHLGVKYSAAIFVASWPAVHPLNVAWMAENTGSVGKRTIATGAMSGFAAIHGTWSSQIYRSDDAPNFRRGNTINAVFTATALLGWISLKYFYRYRNARNASLYAKLTPEERKTEQLLQDDKGNRSVLFRFTN